MGRIPAWLLRHQITIEPFRGHGATGPEYGPPVEVPAFVEERRRIVRALDGRQVVSATTAYVPPGTEVSSEARVTVRGRAARVVEVLRRDGGGLPTPDHVEIILE